METEFVSAGGLKWLRHRRPTVTFCLAAPFDEICRRLDLDYLDDAWRGLAETLPRFGLDPMDCELGAGHPGVMSTPSGSWEDSPLTGFGWLLEEAVAADRLGVTIVPGDWLDVWGDLEDVLAELAVPLMVARHGYRSHVVRRDEAVKLPLNDASTMLSFLFDLALEEMTDWRARDDAGPGPWGRCAAAMAAKNKGAFDEAVAACFAEYSNAGTELVIRGFAGHLLSWFDPAYLD